MAEGFQLTSLQIVILWSEFQLVPKYEMKLKPRSINLTVTAVMMGGTQLVEGVVIRAFVASQANHVGFMIGGVKTQYPVENKHG